MIRLVLSNHQLMIIRGYSDRVVTMWRLARMPDEKLKRLLEIQTNYLGQPQPASIAQAG